MQKEGTLVTDPERIEQANKSKQERAKFDKEQHMCKVLARAGYDVRHISDVGGGYDILLNGVPYDLKSTKSANNIARYAKHATKEQGAKGVVFEFEVMSYIIKKELDNLSRGGIHGFYFIKGKNDVHTF